MNTPPRILVPVMDWDRPAGGIRKLYRHVDVLNANGIEAVVMHQQPGFRCTWFQNSTTVKSFDEVGTPRPSDIVMVPEILAWQFVTLWPGTPKVIFSQNAYQTFAWRTQEHHINPYLHPDFRPAIVVSEDSRAYLNYTFPRLPIFRIRYSIDPQLFAFATDKKPQIAYMPRKKEPDATQVLAILKYRGALAGWNIVRIESKSESETARILRESAIFLSFSTQEGWGLPPMEAMACGCAVIGYDGRGGAEYLKLPHATPIEPADIPAFTSAVQRALDEFNRNPQATLDRGHRASEFIHSQYSMEQEAGDIITTWHRLFAMIPKASAK